MVIRLLLSGLLFISTLLVTFKGSAAEHINVISIKREPYVIVDHKQERGLTYDLIDIFNQVQDKYHFAVKIIPTRRLHKHARDGDNNIVMWDHPDWGWKNVGVSLPLVTTQDIYIAHRDYVNGDQSYFDDLTDKSIAAVRGYHYQFNDAQARKENKYNIRYVTTDTITIKMALYKRSQVALTSNISLGWFLRQNPAETSKLVVANKIDDQFQRYILTPMQSKVSIDEINHILKVADQKNLLAPVYQKYGLAPPNFTFQ
nr:transporter substrate-binding domain-containing protein [Endozoicomonas sp. G2_1]